MEKLDAVKRARILNVITEHDKRESAKEQKRGRVNIYRLGIMMDALERIDDQLAEGQTLRESVLTAFCGSLADKVLKAVGEPVRDKSTSEKFR